MGAAHPHRQTWEQRCLLPRSFLKDEGHSWLESCPDQAVIGVSIAVQLFIVCLTFNTACEGSNGNVYKVSDKTCTKYLR